jgi:hypothetical protein
MRVSLLARAVFSGQSFCGAVFRAMAALTNESTPARCPDSRQRWKCGRRMRSKHAVFCGLSNDGHPANRVPAGCSAFSRHGVRRPLVTQWRGLCVVLCLGSLRRRECMDGVGRRRYSDRHHLCSATKSRTMREKYGVVSGRDPRLTSWAGVVHDGRRGGNCPDVRQTGWQRNGHPSWRRRRSVKLRVTCGRRRRSVQPASHPHLPFSGR